MKRILTALSAFVMMGTAWGFDPDLKVLEDPTLSNKYPSGSIINRERADRAQAEIKSARQKLNNDSDYQIRRCYENFFVNSCIEDVRKAKIRQERRLQSIDSEVRRVIREDNAAKERAKQAERDKKYGAAPKQQTKRSEKEATPAKKDTRLAKRQQQVAERQKAAQTRQQAEAQNRQAYEAKVRKNEERQKERERKLKERAKKNAQ